MKRIFLFKLFIIISVFCYGQKSSKTDQAVKAPVIEEKKPNCDSIVVDFETGLLNGKLGPSMPVDSIKKYLPCITAEIPMGSEDRICGGGASLEKHGIYFNLEHGYIEFSASTRAHLTLKVMGVTEEDLTAITGDPVQIMDLQPYTDRAIQSVYLYPKSYGCLAIWVDQKEKKAYKVQLHNTDMSKANLCFE